MFIGYQEKIVGYETKEIENELGEKEQVKVPIKEEFIALAANTREELEHVPCISFTRIEEVKEEYTLFNGKWILKNEADALILEQKNKDAIYALESHTGLTRAVRELVLAENSGVSDFVRQQAQKIENMALPLREDNKI